MAENWYDPNRYNQYNAQQQYQQPQQYPPYGYMQPQYAAPAPQQPHYDSHGWQQPTAAQYGFVPQPYNGYVPNLAPGIDVGNILEAPPDQLPNAIARIGAMNTSAPIVHSSHLRNRITGLVLPWNPLLAEQRDIMMPCDEYGNTNPEAWQKTVVQEEGDTPQEAYWKARTAVVTQAMQYTNQYRDNSIDQGTIPTNGNPIPPGTMPFEKLSEDRTVFAPPAPPQTAPQQQQPMPYSVPPAASAPTAPQEERDGVSPIDALTALCDTLGV